jgi:hypothetical protein
MPTVEDEVDPDAPGYPVTTSVGSPNGLRSTSAVVEMR